MEPDEIHPRVLRELTDVIGKPLSIIYQRTWDSGEVCADWKLTGIILAFKNVMREDPGNYITSVPGKVTEKIILVVIESQLKSKALIGHS